jgi:GYF domain
MSSSNSGGSLRPAWNRGNSKGFQPPPQVEQQSSSSRNKSVSSNNDHEHPRHANPSNNASQRDNYNKFSALDIDDDDVVIATTTSGASTLTNLTTNATEASKSTTAASTETPAASIATNTRSEALRNAGRSLADLAARAPPATERGRFSNLRTSSVGSSTEVAGVEPKVPEEKVIRYTRERLLSMRPKALPAPRDELKFELEGSSILSEVALDPVCWDNFDAEKIWATVTSRRLVKDDTNPPGLGVGAAVAGGGVRRSSSTNAGPLSLRREASAGGNTAAGRWQRGVALPPEGSTLSIGGTKSHRSTRDGGGNNYSNRDAENPNDLWDDPAVLGDGALMDFSAFGDTGGGDADGAFDFDKMAEASKKLEDEMRGVRSRTSSNATNDDDNGDVVPSKTVNPNRPLATVGTTIRSGSGDHVNVFEDFDDPGVVAEDISGASKGAEEPLSTPIETEVPTIKAANEDPTASSRLMAMIGVKKDESVAQDASLMAWGDAGTTSSAALKGVEATVRVSLNPWGDPVLPGSVAGAGAIQTSGLVLPGAPSAAANDLHQHNLDLQARLHQAELEKQKIDESRRLQQQEQERLRVLQQQEQERARVLQQQQQAGVQSRVELVLMERISAILEKSWGRSDLMTILSTLHAEDQRVMPLLNNIDSLRALLMRHPRRFAIRQDPTTRMEVVALLITNAQWISQQQQQDALHQQQSLLLQQQQEERQRLEQQRRLEEQQAAIARAQQQQQQQIVPDAPWYYSDPSKNIQGPFRGDEMRQWLEAGYFKGDLPISQSPNGPFRPLATIFKDLSTAFMNPNSQDIREEQQRLENAERARAAAEAQERERHRAEQQRKEKEGAAAAAAEQQRLQQARAEAEAQAKVEKMKNANGGNESSAQLKLMLGLGTPPDAMQQSNKMVTGKGTRPLDQRPASNEEINARQQSLDSPSLGHTKASAPAWGGAAVSQPITKKSMSEIQKEEARAAAVAAMNRSTKPSSSGWANIAAAKGATTAWSGGPAKPQPTAILSTPAATAGVRRVGPTRSTSLQPASISSAAAAAASSSVPGQVQRSNSVATHDQSTSVEAFGATMDPGLEQWCKEQMNKLNGTDDLTLVAFCMTLSDSEEIRQYLTAYLGSTPQVNAFATEFLQRKGGNQKKNIEEWESTATAKKGKKKKAGAN